MCDMCAMSGWMRGDESVSVSVSVSSMCDVSVMRVCSESEGGVGRSGGI